MKKTSVYLDDADVERLRLLSARLEMSRAEVIRAALHLYESTSNTPRFFHLDGAWEGDGTSIADVPEDGLLEGFGD